MLKKSLLQFVYICASAVAFFHSKRTALAWNYILDKFYTFYMSRFLKEAGRDVLLCRYSSFHHPEYVSIGPYSSIGRFSRIEAYDEYMGARFSPRIVIGARCSLGEYSHLTAVDGVIIGDGVLTGRRVTLSDNNHGAFVREELDKEPIYRSLSSKGPVVIGDNVWIGENVCVLSGVTIGQGCVIAANAVVTKDMPPYSLVAGVPARVVRCLEN